MPHQLPSSRNEYCVVCQRTTTWRLHERSAGAMYVCSGGSKTLNSANTIGCGREVPANDFHVRHRSAERP